MRASFFGRSLLVLAPLIGAYGARTAEPDARLPVKDALLAWYDARQLIGAANEGLVDRWPDASGNNHPATALPEPFQPLLVVESKPNAENAYVRFDGADDFLVAQDLGKKRSATVFLVMRPIANGGEFRAVLSASPADRNDYQVGFNIDLGPWTTPDWSMLNVESAGAGGVANLLASPKPFGEFHVVSLAWDSEKSITCNVDGKREGSRPFGKASINLDRLYLGCRHYRNEAGPPYERGFFEGDVAEVLIYGRALPENERAAVERYLSEKHASLMGSKVDVAEPFRMLMPGFTVKTLPLDVTNINDMAYDDKDRLWLLGYDGRIHVATDTDGDGLEDKLATYWDKPTFQGPIAMVLRPDGIYVSAKTKISKIVDENKDDKGDREVVVVSGWEPPQNYSGGVDALGMAFDDIGNLYFALGCSDFTNAYLVKDGRSHYSRSSERGTIQQLQPNGRRETVCTGVRFPVSLAMNANGALFATDQEGETWLPGGNPLDELLEVSPDRHYGFPPRHREYLPDVFDEPAVETYGPQHQSTCGLAFNPMLEKQKCFGPPNWRGDAFVAGYSRGKVWRTKLAGAAQTQLIASSRMLLVDVTVSPEGCLVVSAHSGQPDWGSGPTGRGTLFKIKYDAKTAAVPIAVCPASPVEVDIVFPKTNIPTGIREAFIEYGEFVRAGDRFEVLRPGYEAVRRQQLAPRRQLAVHGVNESVDERMITVATSPHPEDCHYSITLRKDTDDSRPIDISYDLGGVEARLLGEDRTIWRGWLPHLSDKVNFSLLTGSDFHEPWFSGRKFKTRASLRTRVSPWFDGGQLVIESNLPLEVKADNRVVAPERRVPGGSKFRMSLSQPTLVDVEAPNAYGLVIDAYFALKNESESRSIPLSSFRLPWAPPKRPQSTSPPPPAPEIAGGDWKRGQEIFFGNTAQCSACHKIAGKGAAVGPDLSNLVHRDVASVTRDIIQPSAAINPDYIPMTVLLASGEILSGLMRPVGDGKVAVTDSNAKERIVDAGEIDEYKASDVSVMPKGIEEKIGAAGMRDLLTFLTTAEPKPPESAGGHAPPKRTKAEIDKLLAQVPAVDPEKLRPLNIVLVASPQDHGPGEHDYPNWQKRWKELLAKAPKTRVSTAFEWPEQSQFDLADVVVFYFWNHDWNKGRYEQLDRYMKRGGGVVVLHAATIADKEPEQLASRIGLAYKFGPAKFRHGPVVLDVASPDHPIVRGLKKIDLVDETYWGIAGEPTRVRILATAVEENEVRPILWTFEPESGGRVFASVIGHYLWTFDDPVFRTVLLRGIAWTAREPESRLHAIVSDGVELTTKP